MSILHMNTEEKKNVIFSFVNIDNTITLDDLIPGYPTIFTVERYALCYKDWLQKTKGKKKKKVYYNPTSYWLNQHLNTMNIENYSNTLEYNKCVLYFSQFSNEW